MTLSDLIATCRTEYLFDVTPEYKWSNNYLARLFTLAERESCRRASLILDKTTQTAGNIDIGTATISTVNKLVDTGATFTYAYLGLTVYNYTDNTWATITAVDSGTILSLSADIMENGDTYAIGDSTKALARVCVISGTYEYPISEKITKIDQCYLASRGRQYPLTQKVEINSNYTGIPTCYTERKKLLRLFPTPDDSINSGTGKDTLCLEVYRLPLVDLTMDNQDSSPEIDEEYHDYLIDYVCWKAFQKTDEETFDATKSLWHEKAFADKFGPAISDDSANKLRMIPSDFSLRKGNFGL